ncbi:MAG TPA: hypothetical protein PLM07_11010 [Candidatus Rifleibacterium sp.]|nr:hypothetical protein [Candidatus Rifleibacterium sp.]HPT46422.1 hypothetical protein [Candidatus Rifleibacterium sp.]
MTINPMDILKVPFKIGERISRPVMNAIDDFMGKDVDSFLEQVPGGRILQNATGSFNRWMLEKKETITGSSDNAEDAVKVEDDDGNKT